MTPRQFEKLCRRHIPECTMADKGTCGLICYCNKDTDNPNNAIVALLPDGRYAVYDQWRDCTITRDEKYMYKYLLSKATVPVIENPGKPGKRMVLNPITLGEHPAFINHPDFSAYMTRRGIVPSFFRWLNSYRKGVKAKRKAAKRNGRKLMFKIYGMQCYAIKVFSNWYFSTFVKDCR